MKATEKRLSASQRQRIRQRTKALRGMIDAMDYVASGTLHTRTKVCGRSNCKCADDPSSRHGPYYEWSRRQDARLVHSVVSQRQAAWIELAISNYRTIESVLAQWELETAAEILEHLDDDKR